MISIFLLSAWMTADPAEKPSRAEQFQAIQSEFHEKLIKAMSNPDKTARVTAEQYYASLPKLKDYAPRIFALIEENPKDDLSFDMLAWLATAPSAPNVPDDVARDAYGRLIKDFSRHSASKLLPFLDRAQMTLPQAEPFLNALLRDHPERSVQGRAAYALAAAAHHAADRAPNPRAMALAEERALLAFRKVQDEFPDTPIGRDKKPARALAASAIAELEKFAIGKPFPAIQAPTPEGKTESLADYRGKVVILDIWATWCGPCKAMIPHEREMMKRFADKPVALISLSADDKLETLKEFLEKTAMPWVHWWGGDNKLQLMRELHVRHYPTIYVLDHQGIIRYKAVRGERLEKAVEALLAEK